MGPGSGRLRRRRPRTLSPRLIVACEGERTEYEYLTRLDQSIKQRRAALKVLAGRRTDAVGVVEAAIRQRSSDRENQSFSRRDGDRVYAILDVEPHDPSKAGKLEAALRLAGSEDVRVLLSNPSFEFWLLCHVAQARELCRAFRDPGSLDRELRKRLGHGKDDLHSNPALFDRLLPNAPRAVLVARHVHEQHHNNVDDLRGSNACTTVYKLIAYLIGDQPDLP
ncbi:MAG TPA: RloB family protein [Phycisphaerae bacterium]|nr:RloB family protein [Phycisphaerae bacterium]